MCVYARLVQLVEISDCQREDPGFNPRPGRGLHSGRPSSFATLFVDMDAKPLV